jgi:PadR family transcriptional regulator, regulatory protein AphA
MTSNTHYLECDPTFVIRTERDILELIGLCGEHETNQILIYESSLSADFFDLKTKLAGTLFQKLANYHLRGAGLISLKQIKGERFKELVFECNQGNLFRFFEDKAAAEKWLAHE